MIHTPLSLKAATTNLVRTGSLGLKSEALDADRLVQYKAKMEPNYSCVIRFCTHELSRHATVQHHGKLLLSYP